MARTQAAIPAAKAKKATNLKGGKTAAAGAGATQGGMIGKPKAKNSGKRGSGATS